MNENCLFFIVSIIVAYFCGAVPIGFLIGKMRGVDVRTVGSKNIGATNVYRTVAKPWGILAFIGDFLKGFLPTLVVKMVFVDLQYLPLVVGIMTVVGHMFTCFMKFKGGKGVATGFGMLVALVPAVVLSAFALWVVVMLVSHYISLASIAAAAYLGVIIWIPIAFMGNPGYHNIPQAIVVTIVASASIIKHRTNIQRLLAGNENKIY
jgi:glycerol-3-phosphate acyltransferase PlsY